jgi:hypothetical protein
MIWIGFQGGVVHPALGRTAAVAVAQWQQAATALQRLRAAAEEGNTDTSATSTPKYGLQAALQSREGDCPAAANDGHSSAARQQQRPSAAGGKAPGAGRRRQPL